MRIIGYITLNYFYISLDFTGIQHPFKISGFRKPVIDNHLLTNTYKVADNARADKAGATGD